MFTFHFWLISTLQLFTMFVLAIALVYVTKIIDLWLEECEKEHNAIRLINLFVCEISSNIAIAMPFLIFLYMIVMGIIVILI